MRILIVDDDQQVIAALTRRYLEMTEVVCQLCLRIEDVKVAVEEHQPQILIFDHSIRAVGGDGYQIAELYKDSGMKLYSNSLASNIKKLYAGYGVQCLEKNVKLLDKVVQDAVRE